MAFWFIWGIIHNIFIQIYLLYKQWYLQFTLEWIKYLSIKYKLNDVRILWMCLICFIKTIAVMMVSSSQHSEVASYELDSHLSPSSLTHWKKWYPSLFSSLKMSLFFAAKHWLFSSKRPLFRYKTLTFQSKIPLSFFQ